MKENSKSRVMVVQVCEECGAEFPIWRRKSRRGINLTNCVEVGELSETERAADGFGSTGTK